EFLGLARRFPAAVSAVRERLAAYVGARPEDLVLVPNATTGINMVARSLHLRPGDEIVTTTHEYGGNKLLWRYVCERAGARCVEVATWPATAVDDLLGAVISATTALRFPVNEICACAREAGVL